jgi:hypothetical protein
LWLPISPLAILIVILYQLSYLLDFSDGELARLRNESSHAGSYLDWLGHFYVPVISAGILGIRLSAETGIVEWALLGLLAAVGLATFHFSCKEHIVIAYLRHHPEDAGRPEVQNVLRDRPLKSAASMAELPPNRSSAGSFVPLIGSALIYPGAMHLLCMALLLDFAITSAGGPANAGRGMLLGIWAMAFVVHAAFAITRNFNALRGLDELDRLRRLSQE